MEGMVKVDKFIDGKISISVTETGNCEIDKRVQKLIDQTVELSIASIKRELCIDFDTVDATVVSIEYEVRDCMMREIQRALEDVIGNRSTIQLMPHGSFVSG